MRPPRYILRFDDLCPTMNRGIWDRVEVLLGREDIQPILAVIPENRDPEMLYEDPDPNFWSRARSWQARGWVLGQHGFRHLYDSKRGGMVPWWTQSEFAGHPRDLQRERASQGLEKLRGEGLDSAVWVAPSHSFDGVTLEVLRELGFRAVSDGVGFRPYRDRWDLVRIPVRPWPPPGPARGTATFCVHPNILRDTTALERLIARYRGRWMGQAFQFEEVLSEARPRAVRDAVSEKSYWFVFSARRAVKRAVRPGSAR